MSSRVEIIRGDITKLPVDAIVNASKNSLRGGGGVDGAIHRAGGKAISKECKEIRKKQGGCKTGEAVITTAGNLPAKYVIHTVGPIWKGGDKGEGEKLRDCYRNSLKLAVANNLKTIAFPSISTGSYRFPKQWAAEIAAQEVFSFLSTDNYIQKVLLVCFDGKNYEALSRYVGEKQRQTASLLYKRAETVS